MIDPYLTGTIATGRQHDNERRIAAAELRRQAKLTRHTTPVSPPSDPIVTAFWARIAHLGAFADVRLELSLRLGVLLGRRVPA